MGGWCDALDTPQSAGRLHAISHAGVDTSHVQPEPDARPRPTSTHGSPPSSRRLTASWSRWRAGHPRAYQARIACRRLRSALLATFRPLFDRDVTEPVREEPGGSGSPLSDSRDRYVVGQRLFHQLADEPLSLTVGRVASRLWSTHLSPTEVP